MTTPEGRSAGEEALREAARLESARVYGKTCPEYRHGRAPVQLTAVRTAPRPRLKAVS